MERLTAQSTPDQRPGGITEAVVAVTKAQVDRLRTLEVSGLTYRYKDSDRGISAIDLRYEYEVAAPAAGLSPEGSAAPAALIPYRVNTS